MCVLLHVYGMCKYVCTCVLTHVGERVRVCSCVCMGVSVQVWRPDTHGNMERKEARAKNNRMSHAMALGGVVPTGLETKAMGRRGGRNPFSLWLRTFMHPDSLQAGLGGAAGAEGAFTSASLTWSFCGWSLVRSLERGWRVIFGVIFRGFQDGGGCINVVLEAGSVVVVALLNAREEEEEEEEEFLPHTELFHKGGGQRGWACSGLTPG
ncbi:unnamed protein product [Bubo scandiacus]